MRFAFEIDKILVRHATFAKHAIQLGGTIYDPILWLAKVWTSKRRVKGGG